VDADRGESQPYFRQAVELGITVWDTANVYSYGGSEEIVGRAIERFVRPVGTDGDSSGISDPIQRTLNSRPEECTWRVAVP
jgi:hypothetical protein